MKHDRRRENRRKAGSYPDCRKRRRGRRAGLPVQARIGGAEVQRDHPHIDVRIARVKVKYRTGLEESQANGVEPKIPCGIVSGGPCGPECSVRDLLDRSLLPPTVAATYMIEHVSTGHSRGPPP